MACGTLLMLSLLSFCQLDNDAVRDQLLKVFKPRVIEKGAFEQTVFTKSVSWDDDISTEKSTTTQRNSSSHVMNARVEVYSDERNAFIIIPEERIIVRRQINEETAYVLKGYNIVAQDTVFKAREYVIKSSKIVSVNTINEEGVEFIKVVLSTTVEAQKAYKIAKWVIWYNPKDLSLKRSWTYFTVRHELKEMMVSYDNVHLDKRSSVLKKPVIEYVLDAKGQPTGDYKGFELIEE